MKKTLLFAFVLFGVQAFAQRSTYNQVFDIFQAKCGACHTPGVNQGNLILTGNDSLVWTKIYNRQPVNPVSKNKGHKLIFPGQPEKSLIMRKINHGFDINNELEAGEGVSMPEAPNPTLTDYEKELIRQWIYHGALRTYTTDKWATVDTTLLVEYYSGKGINSVPVQPPAPAAGTGFQIHLGKVFVPKATETEVFTKFNSMLADSLEIYKMELAVAPQTHHFVVYKFFNPGEASTYTPGFRDTSFTNHGASHGHADALTAFAPWQKEILLPTGTAYPVEGGAVFDLDLHVYNTNQDTVVGIDVYINCFTQPKHSAEREMLRINFPYLDIVLPPLTSPTDTTIFDNQLAYDSLGTNDWEIWNLYTHTHQYGLDYDVWQANNDFTKGTQVYEGFMKYDAPVPFDQGYYPWGVNSPQEHIYDTTKADPFLRINPLTGLIGKVKFRNTSNHTIYFGLTSEDEMSVIGFELAFGAPIPTVVQLNTDSVVAASTSNEIVRILINNAYKTNANLTSLTFDMTGTTNEALDVTKATLYKTGNSTNFSTATAVGSVNNPSGIFTIPVTESLPQGENYYWLAYDIKSTAPNGDRVDGKCVSAMVNGELRTANTANTKGDRRIVNVSGINTLSGSLKGVRVSPNPNTGRFVAEFWQDNKQEEVKVQVVDLLGREVYTKSVVAEKGKNLVNVDISEFSKGIYMISLSSSTGSVTKKLVVE